MSILSGVYSQVGSRAGVPQCTWPVAGRSSERAGTSSLSCSGCSLTEWFTDASSNPADPQNTLQLNSHRAAVQVGIVVINAWQAWSQQHAAHQQWARLHPNKPAAVSEDLRQGVHHLLLCFVEAGALAVVLLALMLAFGGPVSRCVLRRQSACLDWRVGVCNSSHAHWIVEP